jgi:hypothetical protein
MAMIPPFDSDGLLPPSDYLPMVPSRKIRNTLTIDGYFECDLRELMTGELERKLNLLDPSKVWTWDPASRTPYRGYPKKQLPMWHKYRVELYPHVPGLGIGSGIVDKYGNELEFPSAFRQCRGNGKPRGIVKIKYGGQP